MVSRNAATDDALLDVVRTAEEAARVNGPAEDAAPLVPPGAALGGPWDTPPAETSVGVFAALAPALGEAFARARAEGRAVYGFAEHRVTTTYLRARPGCDCATISPPGAWNTTRSPPTAPIRPGWGRPRGIFATSTSAALDAEATTRLGWGRRRLELPPGRYETVLPPGAVADLMIYLYWSSGARNAHDGRTVLSRPGGGTRVGERLSDLAVTLRSDPGLSRARVRAVRRGHRVGLGPVRLRQRAGAGPTDWISDGTLTSLLTTRHSAALTGLPLTPAIDNLVLEGPGGRRALPAARWWPPPSAACC